jgi:hypothetical protein
MNEAPHTSDNGGLLTIRKALLLIGLSTLVITGSCAGFMLYMQHHREKQWGDPAYNIVALVQTSPHVQGLKTSYLAELLGLSVDRPGNLFLFSSSEATNKLMASPVIKAAKVRKIRPGTIHVDYELRKPIAYLGDYRNAAIDRDGVVFPFKPFYSPKRLPQIRLGVGDDAREEGGEQLFWGGTVSGMKRDLALTLLKEAPDALDAGSTLLTIDVSKADAPSDGQREIILTIEDKMTKLVGNQSIQCIYPRLLRLRPESCRQQLANYRALGRYLRNRDKQATVEPQGTFWRAKPVVIDMRLSELAFISDDP